MAPGNPARLSRWLILLALCSLVAAQGKAPAAPAQTAPARTASVLPKLDYVDVSPSVTMLQNERTSGANITCIVLEEGLVFVDASLFTEIAAKFREDMEARFKKKTLALLLTHAHTDHFFGMGAFADVPVFAAASGRDLFTRQLSIDYEKNVEGFKSIFPRFDEALKTARFFMPTIWVETEVQIGAGEKHVAFRNSGGHTTCSSYAHVESDGVIVTGDNVQVDAYPYFGDPTGNMKTLVETLEAWEGVEGVKICPGHGRAVDRAYLSSVRAYFVDLRAALKKLKAEGVGVEEAARHPRLPAGYWGERGQEPIWFRPSIAGVYRSIDTQ